MTHDIFQAPQLFAVHIHLRDLELMQGESSSMEASYPGPSWDASINGLNCFMEDAKEIVRTELDRQALSAPKSFTQGQIERIVADFDGNGTVKEYERFALIFSSVGESLMGEFQKAVSSNQFPEGTSPDYLFGYNSAIIDIAASKYRVAAIYGKQTVSIYDVNRYTARAELLSRIERRNSSPFVRLFVKRQDITFSEHREVWHFL